MENHELQNKLSEAIKAFYHPDAANRIADEILKIIEA
jgi:UDP-N-acetylglucosamine:LPS N-acetylglucosamine transferase